MMVWDENIVTMFGNPGTKYCDLEVHSGDDIYQNWNPGGRYDKIAAVGFVEQRFSHRQ